MKSNFEYSSKEFNLLLEFVTNNLGHRKQIPFLVKCLKLKPELLKILLTELDQAIDLFNEYQQGGDVEPLERGDFLHSKYLSAVLEGKSLPNVTNTIKHLRDNSNQIKQEIVPLLNQFEFLDIMTPPEKAVAALTILSYRSVMLASNQLLISNNVMVGSALEEMICLMAIRGNSTKIFAAIRDWITTDDDEGFSTKLVTEVKNLKEY